MPVTMKPSSLRAVAIRALRFVEQLTVRVTKAVHGARTQLEGTTLTSEAEKKAETKPKGTKPATPTRTRRTTTRTAA